MNNLQNLPDLGRAAMGLKISCDLEDIPDDTTLGYKIKKLNRHDQTSQAIQMILETAKTNRPFVEEVVGPELLARIEKYAATPR